MRVGRLILVVATLVAILLFPLMLRDAVGALKLPSAYAAPNTVDAGGRVYQNGNNDDNDNRNGNNGSNSVNNSNDSDDDEDDNDNAACYESLNSNEEVPCDDNGNSNNNDNYYLPLRTPRRPLRPRPQAAHHQAAVASRSARPAP